MIRQLIVVALITVLCGTNAHSADDPRSKAIELGAQYIKGLHQPKDGYDGGSHKIGGAALCGLALLESGVPAADPAVKNIADFVRTHAFRQDRTYEISLCLMFLDRLGDRVDVPAVQLLAVQLMTGQGSTGKWTYTCPLAMSDEEIARLKKVFYEGKAAPVNVGVLHPDVARRLREVEAALKGGSLIGASVDHSNTQFALIALWIARKHGVPVINSIALADKHFRLQQRRNGGWPYTETDPNDIVPPENDSTATMTCSGLVALAVGRGAALHALRTKGSTAPKGGVDFGNLVADRAAAAALRFVENSIIQSGKAPAKANPDGESKRLIDNMYFLWSLERVCMIYDLEKIGSVDWYQWGYDHLIKTQAKDGSWSQKGYDGANEEINTAFALLFLTRANLAKDLTSTLRTKGKNDPKVDPGKVEPKETPKVDPEVEINRLCNELVLANASQRPAILAKLRDTKGIVYTEALLRAIRKLKPEQQTEAREALAQRLKRMTAATLRENLKDADAEIRNAAAAACGLKADKAHIPDLLAVLTDKEVMVAQSARGSLKTLSGGKDFGPEPTAVGVEKIKAIEAWKNWWATQPKS